MSDTTPSDQPASMLAEEILRTIYGDDLKGCDVSLEKITEIIAKGISPGSPTKELLALYEKVVEAVHLLSVPPPVEKIADPKELQLLLSKRLDSIHTITTKTSETIGRFKGLGEKHE